MKYIVALLLLSTVVYAQPRGTPFGQATTSPLKLYVNPSATGASDSNTCLNAVQACLTPQGAYNKVPKQVKHPVTINLACGTWTQGAYVTGDIFIYDATNDGGYAPGAGSIPSVTFTGAWDAGVLASGLQSGSIVSATGGGTSNPSVNGTFSVTAASWTTNDLANRFVQITSGADVGEIRAILSNTNANPGVATIQGTWAVTPDATSTFAIIAPCSIVQNGLAEENPNLPTQIGVGATQAAFIVREPLGASFLTPQVTIQNLEISVVNAGKGIVAENPGTNLLIQGVTFVNGASSASVANSRAFVMPTAGASVTVLNDVFTPAFQLQGIANNVVLSTIPMTINSPTYDYSGVVVRNSIFAYGAITGNVGPIAMFGGQLSTWQNSLIGNGAFLVDLQGTRWISQGDTFTANSSAGSVVATNFFTTANIRYTSAVFLSATFVGSGATTVGLSTDFNAASAHTLLDFADGNSSVTGFCVAYRIAAYNATLSGNDNGFIPVPSGSTCTDIQFGEQKTAYSMAQLNAQSPKVLIDSLSGDAIYNDGEHSQTTWLPGGYHLLTSIPYANLLTCDALHTGAQAWDTTNQCVSTCNGTVWGCVAISPGGGPLVTSGPLSLFVATTGADSSNCQSAGSPCLTIDYARQQIPPQVQDQVIVNVAAGTYTAGAYVNGFTFSINHARPPTSQTVGAPSIRFVGAYTTPSIATGPTSGTVTSGTAGQTGLWGTDQDPSVWATVTVNAAGWTVNNLTGHLVNLTGGTCATGANGWWGRIDSNTATVITIDGVFGALWNFAPDATCSFAIVDPGAVITGTLNRPGGALGYSYVVPSSSGGTAAFYAYNNTGFNADVISTSLQYVGAGNEPLISFEGFSFTDAADGNPVGIAVAGSSDVAVLNCNGSSNVYYIASASNGSRLWMSGLNFSGVNAVVLLHNAYQHQAGGLPAFARVVGSYITGGAAILESRGANNVALVAQNDVISSGCAGQCVGLITSPGMYAYSVGNIYATTGSPAIAPQGYYADGDTVPLPGTNDMIFSEGDTFNNTLDTVFLKGGGRATFIGTASKGSGNTTGVSVQTGSWVEWVTASGTTSTTDISIDGTAYTLTQLRAATPKSIVNLNTMSGVHQE